MKEIVKLSALESYTFEQLICSDYQRRLVVYVKPSMNHMHFKLTHKGMPMGIYGSLENALDEYNKL